MAVAAERIERLRLDPRQKAGKMSGGQRAQLALTMAIAKNPELLIMDEPIASLDPLARSDFLRSLADFTAARQVSVVLSSHLLGDLERICDYLIVLVGSRVQVAGEVSDLLASHRMLTGVRADPAIMPPGSTVISASRDGRPRMVLARVAGPVDETAWPGGPITLEDLVLAYMSRATDAPRRESALKGQS
jgi:ABC-2 type transport system ATP-binding protein